jgi:putative SOS response-associated peptidase YedK
MCGRYTIRALQPIVDMFGLALPDDFPSRCNIAPTQDVPIIRAAQGDSSDARRLDLLRWGLVPSWAKDPSVGNRLINARAETAVTKPAFRDAMRRRRCLVPADGFYEWKKLDAPAGAPASKGKKAARKQPYLFRMKGDKPFAFAGLWDTWQRDGEELESFTILTTSPNALVAAVHDRMPVIVAPED